MEILSYWGIVLLGDYNIMIEKFCNRIIGIFFNKVYKKERVCKYKIIFCKYNKLKV